NSFVTDSEIRLLKTLIERTPLTNAVINILIHYVLVIQNNSTLQERFVTTIAANWSEKGFKTPEMAIEYVRQYVRESKEKQREKEEKKQTQAKRTYAKKPVRNEVLPEWIIEPKEIKEDPEKQAAIQRRLQEYLKRKEGEQ
ncbi:MAG: DnaD domain protein, partial [Enterococcus lemanii]